MTKEELEEVMKAVDANRPHITQTMNFNAPIGQQISHVDKMEAHFDKDMGMQITNAGEVDNGMKSEGDEDPVITRLTPIFYNDKAEVRKFLSRIKGVKPTEITATVTRLVREKKVSALSCKGDMWKIMYDAGLYQNEKNTWNRQVII